MTKKIQERKITNDSLNNTKQKKNINHNIHPQKTEVAVWFSHQAISFKDELVEQS